MKTPALETRAATRAVDLRTVVWSDLVTYSTPVRGSLTVVESGIDLPYVLARIFYIYGTTKDSERGAHAHRATWQSFVAIRGSFKLELTNGRDLQQYEMNRADRILHVPPMIWARLYNFTEDAVCLVLASSLYDPSDYVREWEDYVAMIDRFSQ